MTWSYDTLTTTDREAGAILTTTDREAGDILTITDLEAGDTLTTTDYIAGDTLTITDREACDTLTTTDHETVDTLTTLIVKPVIPWLPTWPLTWSCDTLTTTDHKACDIMTTTDLEACDTLTTSMTFDLVLWYLDYHWPWSFWYLDYQWSWSLWYTDYQHDNLWSNHVISLTSNDRVVKVPFSCSSEAGDILTITDDEASDTHPHPSPINRYLPYTSIMTFDLIISDGSLIFPIIIDLLRSPPRHGDPATPVWYAAQIREASFNGGTQTLICHLRIHGTALECFLP